MIKTKLPANGEDYFPFGLVQAAIRHGNGNLDFNEHLYQVAPAMTFMPELQQHIVQREICLLALVEQLDGCAALPGIQLHACHDCFNRGYLGAAHIAIGLCNVSHNGEACGEKSGLDPFLLAYAICRMFIRGTYAPVKVAAQCCAKQCSQWSAKHEAERSTQQCTPPGHYPCNRPDERITGMVPS